MRLTAWVLAILTALVVGAVFLPAAWLAAGLQRWVLPPGRVLLADPQGTLWRGDCLVALSDGRQAFGIPGRVGWRLSPAGLLTGRLDLTLTHPMLARPLALEAGRDAWRAGPGSARVPAQVLVAAGAPFNTLQPQGVLEIAWDTLDGAPKDPSRRFRGRVNMVWRDAGSALTPLRPVGSYRVELTGQGAGMTIALSTLAGPLELAGQGSWSAPGGLRFEGTAAAQPDMQAQLNGLLSILGRRAGDRALLKFGT